MRRQSGAGKQASKGAESRPELTSFCTSSVFIPEIHVLSQSTVFSVVSGAYLFLEKPRGDDLQTVLRTGLGRPRR